MKLSCHEGQRWLMRFLALPNTPTQKVEGLVGLVLFQRIFRPHLVVFDIPVRPFPCRGNLAKPPLCHIPSPFAPWLLARASEDDMQCWLDKVLSVCLNEMGTSAELKKVGHEDT